MQMAMNEKSAVASFQKILVANRGEIAVRVLRTARALGLQTVAVYSEADVDASHVRLADEAVAIGPAAATESYLDIERVLAAARASGAQAIHPGYGFLSENAGFAAACAEAGLVFVGPGPEAIRIMGNKAEAKRRMNQAGVPCIPGYEGADQTDKAMLEAAEEIGFPIMVKAAAGGGGRGMRLVASSEELRFALRGARSEAENAFGSGELILEKALKAPRHVEIQVVADHHSNVIHLGERDCSVQRRHQKVIEEAPCPVMTEALRAAMGAAAVEAARSIGYRGAGTVEFLLDGHGNFYFLEMNTRLQVEHPVTEMITGYDLVAMQIAIARGQPLELQQQDVQLRGHAIEARLYAEDPAADFLPSTGLIELWRPVEAEGLRYDAGIETAQMVSSFYDPLLAKIIAWGSTREIARRRLVNALRETALLGPRSNRGFLVEALERKTFVEGRATTAFIDEEFSAADLAERAPSFEELAAAAVIEYRLACDSAHAIAVTASRPLRHWTSAGVLTSRFRYLSGEHSAELLVSPVGANGYRLQCGDRSAKAELLSLDTSRAEVAIEGEHHRVAYVAPLVGHLHLSIGARTLLLRDANAAIGGAQDAIGGGQIVAPMHGLLLEVFVSAGAKVAKGDRLAVLEAMKMQHEILSQVDGTVTEVLREPGKQVAADELLITIEVDPA